MPALAPHLTSVVLVANPHAGGGRGEDAAVAAAAALQAAAVPARLERTAAPDQAGRLAEAAARDGATLLVAVGGDGTLHEVVNGLMALTADARPVIACVPVGGGNDFARMIGVSGLDAAGAAEVILHGSPRPVDVGRLDGCERGTEYVLNNVGIGFPAHANERRERLRWLGKLSYLLSGFMSVASFRPDRLVVTVDAVSIEGRFVLAHLANGSYCGAGINFAPEARIDDGQLDVVLVTERSKLRTIREWPKLTRGAMREDVAFLRGRHVRVIGPRGLLLHVDGEVRRVPLGVLEARLLPGAVQVVHAPGVAGGTRHRARVALRA